MSKRTVWLCLGVLWVGCDGCGTRSEAPNRASDESPSGSETASAATGTVTGHVKLADGHKLPAYAISDMERKVLEHTQRGPWPDVCTPPKDEDRMPVRLTSEGHLTGVMVAASGFRNATPRPAKTHEVRIEDCRLTPSLVVAVKGDVMHLKNAVDFPFMPTFGPTAVARTLSPGQKFVIDLDRGGVESVLCGFTAPCGRTDVITVYHPVYAVTEPDGTFTIADFPTEQEVDLNAWHPMFEESKITISVGKGETKTVELTLTPKARFEPEPPSGEGEASSDRAGTTVGAPSEPK